MGFGGVRGARQPARQSIRFNNTQAVGHGVVRMRHMGHAGLTPGGWGGGPKIVALEVEEVLVSPGLGYVAKLRHPVLPRPSA